MWDNSRTGCAYGGLIKSTSFQVMLAYCSSQFTRVCGDMEQLKMVLSPQKLTTLFHISKSLTKALIDKEKLKLLTPLQKATEKMTVQDMLPYPEYDKF